MLTLAVSLLILSAPAAALLAYVVHASREKERSSRLPLRLVGRVGSVERTLDPEGFVLVEGELWRARARDCVVEVEPLA
jgi:membrane protein implicated in regulation of membrane protease activity